MLHPATILRKLREYARVLWVRVTLMGLMAFVALGLTQLIEGYVPKKLATTLSGEAADRLLDIIANAMLAATIFSITVMVTVHRATASQWTPRVHRLIIKDLTTQNTLAVFIGAYVYALLGIIFRELGVYVDERAFVLFIVTVMVLALIVFYLIRWVIHLQSFGSLINITREIEEATLKEFKERLKNPCLGAMALTDVPETAETITSSASGYVQHIYPEALNTLAKSHGVRLYLIKDIGDFVFFNEPLVRVEKTGDASKDADEEDLTKGVQSYIQCGDVRTYDQDPRFGLTAMGEVGSKAMSPGVNDPGTAIDVITRIGRILSYYQDETENTPETPLDHIFVAPLDARNLLEDSFAALSRDAGGAVEVQQILQKILSGLMSHPDKGLTKAARNFAETTLKRTLTLIPFDHDRDRVLKAAHPKVRNAIAAPD